MQFDPAIVLLGAVVILLVAVLIGVLYATRDRRSQVSEEDLDELHSRLEALAPEIALLAAQIVHLEEVDRLQREVAHLREENRRLQQEWRKLLDEVARITDLLGRRPPQEGSSLSSLRTSGRDEPEGAASRGQPLPFGRMPGVVAGTR